MLYRKKKGQAAMEFLMTYGWAILAAIIVIGAIGYLYLSNVGSEVAAVSAPFVLNDFILSGTGAPDAIFNIRNGGAESVNTVTFTLSDATEATCNGAATVITTTLASGADSVVNGPAGCALTAGEDFRANIVITYIKAGGAGLVHQSTGSISAKVQA
ncbi:hypothetical protein GOV14_05760 [Candidatus Pacearchaeota archaeon]|nr:hypothetical protein [Candidatus Pacearchaeota archaeon]